jgi:hypothetical protein
VSTALAELARDGQLIRRDDATWLLTGEPLSGSAGALDVVRQRRRLMPTAEEPDLEPEPEAAVAAEPTGGRLGDLQASLEAARQAAARNAAALEQLATTTSALRARTVELRAERAKRLEALRGAAAKRHDG